MVAFKMNYSDYYLLPKLPMSLTLMRPLYEQSGVNFSIMFKAF